MPWSEILAQTAHKMGHADRLPSDVDGCSTSACIWYQDGKLQGVIQRSHMQLSKGSGMVMHREWMENVLMMATHLGF